MGEGTRFSILLGSCGGGDQVREGCFKGVVGTEDVNVDDGFHGVGAKLLDRGEEVTCCSSAIKRLNLAVVTKVLGGLGIHNKIQSSHLLETSFNGILQALRTSDINSTNTENSGA